GRSVQSVPRGASHALDRVLGNTRRDYAIGHSISHSPTASGRNEQTAAVCFSLLRGLRLTPSPSSDATSAPASPQSPRPRSPARRCRGSRSTASGGGEALSGCGWPTASTPPRPSPSMPPSLPARAPVSHGEGTTRRVRRLHEPEAVGYGGRRALPEPPDHEAREEEPHERAERNKSIPAPRIT